MSSDFILCFLIRTQYSDKIAESVGSEVGATFDVLTLFSRYKDKLVWELSRKANELVFGRETEIIFAEVSNGSTRGSASAGK